MKIEKGMISEYRTVGTIEISPQSQLSSLAETENPYLHAATRDNTRLAYQKDVRHFVQWGGVLPATADVVIRYLTEHAKSHNSRTLKRRLTALRQWHSLQGFPDPTAYPTVKKTIKGIEEIHGKTAEKAPALTLDNLKTMVAHLKEQGDLISLRDCALIQIGFFGAFRRSELIAIEYEHLKFSEQGVEILIPRSKTHRPDQGQRVAIPCGNDSVCAVRALKAWCQAANIQQDSIFCAMHQGEPLPRALKPASVSLILKKVALACGFQEASNYSAHSLRRGLATMAARKGASLPVIMRQGRWQSEKMVLEYIEAGQRFEENAVNVMLDIEN